MYIFSALAPIHQAMWQTLRVGIADAPEQLEDGRAAVPEAIGAEVLFTQVCGFPLFRRYCGQAVLLGTPHYAFAGCEGAMHRGAFIVRESDPAQSLAEMRGRVFGCNSIDSNSGMNLPRLSLARIAGGAPFFRRVVWTGAHAASLRALSAGEIDLCAVDCVTWGLAQLYAPALVAELRVLDWTEPSPCLPFVTSVATPAAEVAALRAAVAALVVPEIGLVGVSALDASAWDVLVTYEQEAERLGYSTLA
jgi:ABC-type phosphate/phosphonate transport system substrate-binding protein